MNISAAAKSIQRHLIDRNPDFSFSSIGFTWDHDQKKHIQKVFGLEAILAIRNILYYPIILSVTLVNLVRLIRGGKWERIRSSGGLKGTLSQDFSGISQTISLTKASRMAEKWIKTRDDEIVKVIFIRPDVVLLKDIRLVDYDKDTVYCNNYMGNYGDFRWILDPQFLPKFSNLFSALVRGQIHEPHKWIARYFESQGVAYKADYLMAGVDEEVLRKTRSSGIPFSRLEFTGLSFFEYSRYPQ